MIPDDTRFANAKLPQQPVPDDAVPDDAVPTSNDPVMAGQFAFLAAPGKRRSRGGFLILRPDRLIHVRSRTSRGAHRGGSPRDLDEKIAAHSKAVTVVPLAEIAELDRHDGGDEGFCVVTAAGEQFGFFANAQVGTLRYSEWSIAVREAAAKAGARVAPADDDPPAQGRLEGGPKGSAARVLVWSVATGAVIAASYCGLVIASSDDWPFALAWTGVAMGAAVVFGAPWLSRAWLRVVSVVLTAAAMAAAAFVIASHYGYAVRDYVTDDLWVVPAWAFALASAAGYVVIDYDKQRRKHVNRFHRGKPAPRWHTPIGVWASSPRRAPFSLSRPAPSS